MYVYSSLSDLCIVASEDALCVLYSISDRYMHAMLELFLYRGHSSFLSTIFWTKDKEMYVHDREASQSVDMQLFISTNSKCDYRKGLFNIT